MTQTHKSFSETESFDKGFQNQQVFVTMPPSDQQQQVFKIKTCVLKVNVNCQGCRRKVKKILTKIEGVYSVNVDAEHQRVIVKGNVDPATLIRKLIRSGKHAELWSQKSQQKDINQEQHNQNKIKNTDQLVYPNLDGGGELGDGPWQYEGNEGLEELENLLKGISGNRFAVTGNGNYEGDIASMMQRMGLNERHDNHQGYDFGGSVKNNFQQLQEYPAGSAAYGYQHPSPVMMANLMGSQYNQSPYAALLRTNPQNMQAIMNNRMLDPYMQMQHQY